MSEVKEKTYIEYLEDVTTEQDERKYKSELARNSADGQLVELRNSIIVKTKAVADLYKAEPFSLVKIVNEEMCLEILNEKLVLMEAKFNVLFPTTK
jgi:hypothetical protein